LTFTTEVANKQIQINLVLEIDGTFFSQYQPDSGLVVDSGKVGTVINVAINPSRVDIRNIRTSINSVSFSLLDKDTVISAFIGSKESALANRTVNLSVGFITGSFDFSEYKLISTTQIRSITKRSNSYGFSASEVTDKMNKPVFEIFTQLNGAITDSDSTITVFDTSDFPNSGRLKINDEFMQYTAKTATTFTGVSRGDLNGTAKAQDDGDEVQFVLEVEDNPIDIILQLLESGGGDFLISKFNCIADSINKYVYLFIIISHNIALNRDISLL